MRIPVILALVFCLAPAVLRAQSSDPEQRLPGLSGLERARALAELTDVRENDRLRYESNLRASRADPASSHLDPDGPR